MATTSFSLGILEFTSIAKGYQCTNTVGAESGIEIVEATFVSPGKFFLLFRGAQGDVERVLGKVLSPYRPWLIDSAIIRNTSQDLLNGFYGLTKNQLEGDLLVAEFQSMASALRAAHLGMSQCGLKIIEVRSSRGLGGKSFALLTGPTESVMAGLAEIQLQFRGSDLLVACEAISDLSRQFRQYFTLS